MKNYDELWAAAQAAATKAGTECKPTAMLVQQVNPFTGQVLKTYEPVLDGACGFAWVKIRPANSSFARWLKSKNIGYKAYNGGWDVSIHAFNQSHERKAAAAQAMAKVLRDAGLDAYSYDRMD
jgi:hypothetical protein